MDYTLKQEVHQLKRLELEMELEVLKRIKSKADD